VTGNGSATAGNKLPHMPEAMDIGSAESDMFPIFNSAEIDGTGHIAVDKNRHYDHHIYHPMALQNPVQMQHYGAHAASVNYGQMQDGNYAQQQQQHQNKEQHYNSMDDDIERLLASMDDHDYGHLQQQNHDDQIHDINGASLGNYGQRHDGHYAQQQLQQGSIHNHGNSYVLKIYYYCFLLGIIINLLRKRIHHYSALRT
jgi:hypothetical protein